MSNIVCPECGASAIVEHQAHCGRPSYVDLRMSGAPELESAWRRTWRRLAVSDRWAVWPKDEQWLAELENPIPLTTEEKL